jgi:hypothetical protein
MGDQTIFQLTDANVASSIFVKYLKPTNEIFRLARRAKAIGSVENAQKEIKIN